MRTCTLLAKEPPINIRDAFEAYLYRRPVKTSYAKRGKRSLYYLPSLVLSITVSLSNSLRIVYV